MTGRPWRTRAMLTVKSSPPLMYSLVPSRGSTRKNASPTVGTSPAAQASSAITAIAGVSLARAARMIASAARSAAVTGEESSFLSTARGDARTLRIASPAAIAVSTRASARTRVGCLGVLFHRPSVEDRTRRASTPGASADIGDATFGAGRRRARPRRRLRSPGPAQAASKPSGRRNRGRGSRRPRRG